MNPNIIKVGVGAVVVIALVVVVLIAVSNIVPARLFQYTVSWAPVPNYGYELSFVRNKAKQNVSLWYLNRESKNVVLYLHGSTGRIGDFFKSLPKDVSILSVAYPGYSESEGEPNYANVYEASELAYQWLLDHNYNESNIIILGHSMGGAPATHLASQKPNAKKLILINTFSSLKSMCEQQLGILCVLVGDNFNSGKNASEITIPVRHFAYEGDTTVPFSEDEKLFTNFTKTTDKQFIKMDKYTHTYPDFELINKEIQAE